MRWIYGFDEGDGSNKALLGGKGAGLCEMTRLGLPVPPGFVITTEACVAFFSDGGKWPTELRPELNRAIAQLEERTGKRFGDERAPLLVSVRSGAAVSMPGMMDTVLNLGLNRRTAAALARATGNERFAWDSYRRFLEMFGDVVLGIPYSNFARAEEQHLARRPIDELDAAEMQDLCVVLEGVITASGSPFPEDPHQQLEHAINAVFNSYNSPRAIFYRKSHNIPANAGTAVNVQLMVFGNMGADSGTGVAFTRNPKSGARGLFGEWLPNAQGEDVVAGIRTPLPINANSERDGLRLEDAQPEAYRDLVEMQAKLETHFNDMQDIEFTIEKGKLFLLQTRRGKRTAMAAVQIVVDMVAEGMIDKNEALARVDPNQLEYILRPVIAPDARKQVIARGLDASPGAACGRVVFESLEAQQLADRDEPTILVRLETNPEDIQGMTAAVGVLTARGGQTSHAAVVARGMGKPCVVGCTEIQVDYARELFYAGDSVVRKGDYITIDGGTGEVMLGKIPMIAPSTDAGAMSELLGWADAVARLKVRTNADSGPDAARARQLGAVGIGLCRTEHMFFQPDALRAIRRMILADDEAAQKRALSEIQPIQRAMFIDIFRAMDGLPVTIRLLDPPLHEFLPQREADVADVANDLGVRAEALRGRLAQLHEANPMMGHRGVRVGITSPEVYRTQVRAIFEAACALDREGVHVLPEVMIPLVGVATELEKMRALVVETAEAVMAQHGRHVDYKVGTMIELPRAAMTADVIARHADFFSFGTNDLTQMTWGFSRDDMGKFFAKYKLEGILRESPLQVFDIEGVGQLVEIGTRKGKETNARLKVGVCGEHGGDPVGIGFFHRVGLDYVSCSPFRVPVARLAAAHAVLGLL